MPPKIREIKNLTTFIREDMAEPEHRSIVWPVDQGRRWDEQQGMRKGGTQQVEGKVEKRLQSSPTARVPPRLSQLTLTACCCRRKGKPPQPALQAGYNPAPAASRERMTLFSRELCTHRVPMPGHQGSTAPTKPAPGRYKHTQPLLAASEKSPV